METWFEIKVKHPKQDEQGRVKDVTEMFLADALSFTEAEAKIYEEMDQRVMGEFEVMTIAKSKVIAGFEYDDADTFYQCKVVYSVVDADTGKEKKVTNLMLVQAKHVGEAFERIKDSLKSMLVTFEVPDIKESKVLEVFHHVADEIPDNLTPLADHELDSAAISEGQAIVNGTSNPSTAKIPDPENQQGFEMECACEEEKVMILSG